MKPRSAAPARTARIAVRLVGAPARETRRPAVVSMSVSLTRALLLVLALVHATGMAEVMQRQACETECRDDGCDDCTPGSESPSCPCHCPSLQPNLPLVIAAVTIIPATRPATSFDSGGGIPPSPDPREISHVPRLAV